MKTLWQTILEIRKEKMTRTMKILWRIILKIRKEKTSADHHHIDIGGDKRAIMQFLKINKQSPICFLLSYDRFATDLNSLTTTIPLSCCFDIRL